MGRSRQRDLAERLAAMNRRSQNAGYTLKRQQPGTFVALALNPLGPDYGTVLKGHILDHTGRRVTIQWVGEGDPEVWNGDDLQYKVDRGLCILTPPPKPRRVRIPKDKLVCKQCGELRKDCDCPPKGALKPEEWSVRDYHPDRQEQSSDLPLTAGSGGDSIAPSHEGTPSPEERKPMATSEKLSAKEVARELGTDARTLRKFFRSGQSPIDPVGQGGRYGIDRKQLKKVRKAFDAWAGGKKQKPPKTKDKAVPEDFTPEEIDGIEAEIKRHHEPDEVDDIDLSDLDGPTDEELDDLEFDLDFEED